MLARELVTDKIAVECRPAGYCCREAPDSGIDNGQCFPAGLEADAYIDDATWRGVYDVDTTPSLTRRHSLRDAPLGSAFERVDGERPLLRGPERRFKTSRRLASTGLCAGPAGTPGRKAVK